MVLDRFQQITTDEANMILQNYPVSHPLDAIAQLCGQFKFWLPEWSPVLIILDKAEDE